MHFALTFQVMVGPKSAMNITNHDFRVFRGHLRLFYNCASSFINFVVKIAF